MDLDRPRAGSLRVAVAQPWCEPCDVRRNVERHVAALEQAQARVVVFPELSLTGYELTSAPTVDPADRVLAPLVEACGRTGSVAFVGAPVLGPDGPSIATLMVSGDGTTVAYRKIWLGSAEQERFTAGSRVETVHVDGWRLSLAICRDTGVDAHTERLEVLGIDLYVAGLVMHPDETEEQSRRAANIARALRAPVAFASFAGSTGSGYPATAGHSAIVGPDGSVLAHAGPEPGAIAHANLPADALGRQAAPVAHHTRP